MDVVFDDVSECGVVVVSVCGVVSVVVWCLCLGGGGGPAFSNNLGFPLTFPKVCNNPLWPQN